MTIKPSANGSISETAHTARTAVGNEFHAFLADIEDLIRETTSLTGEDLNRARAKLNQRVAAAKDSLQEVGGAVSDRLVQGARDTNNYVHAKPWPAIGIGTVVGLLLGFVLARRA